MRTEQTACRRYIDLWSDIGFKIVFGNPDNTALMLGLLNAVIPGRTIERIEFIDPEIRPEEIRDKRVRFDIRCIEPDGRSFVVELQKENYDYMIDRLLVYSGDPLKRLLRSGQEYTEIKPLYIVCISNFIFNFPEDTPEVRNSLVRYASVCANDTGNPLSDKLLFVFLQLPVVRELSGDQGFLAQLAYSIRNIGGMTGRPEELDSAYFRSLFEAADRSYISEANLKIYDYMIRDEIQIKAEKDFAVRKAAKDALAEGMAEGLAEGLAKGKEEGEAAGFRKAAAALKSSGVDSLTISKALGIPVEELQRL